MSIVMMSILFGLLLTVVATVLIWALPQAAGKFHNTLTYCITAVAAVLLLVGNVFFFTILQTRSTINSIAQTAYGYVDGVADIANNAANLTLGDIDLSTLSLKDLGLENLDLEGLGLEDIDFEDMEFPDLLDAIKSESSNGVNTAIDAGASMATLSVQTIQEAALRRLNKYLTIDIIIVVLIFALAALVVYLFAPKRVAIRSRGDRRDEGRSRSPHRDDYSSRRSGRSRHRR